ncbi:MAG TPA: hypothetical protein VHD90_09440 [Phototrophicaceae bacterium]|nr:hypothetical protein [Phototrophicaceae bacterium]
MAQNDVRTRATGAVITNALMRWETFVTVAITVLLVLFVPAPFAWWQAWFWIIAGLVAEGALVVSALSDPNASAEAVAREFEAKYNLSQIRSLNSRKRIADALEYRRNMLKLVDQHGGSMKTQLQQTVADVNDWIGQMYDLALHIDGFQSNDLVERDRRNVPIQLEKVQLRLKQETDPNIQKDLKEQADRLQLQLDNLNSTANSVKRAEIQLDSTLSSLGTIYAQMSALGAKDVDSSRAQRLRADIKDEVTGLQDTIDAMDEVQAQRLKLQ